jgi:sulfur carrier protein
MPAKVIVMIKITLNGQATTLPLSCPLETALTISGYTEGHFAVAVNKTFIPKSRHAHTLLQEGDQVEILAPMQGG